MKILIDPKESLEFDTSAAIGNFDGVHLGHRSILEILKDKSSSKDTKSCVITFDPHPQKVIAKKDISLILPLEERFHLLEQEGVDCTVCLKFTKKLSLLHAKDFVEEILIKLLNIKDIIVGPGFMFGNKRSGNSELLLNMGEDHGFETTVVNPESIDGEIISSSLIRQYIKDGNIEKASKLLGYSYYIRGDIMEGEKRGRKLGFPTANLETDWELIPKIGVYATYAYVEGKRYQSITNIGFRPTFGENRLLIESHLFNFSDNVYNKPMKIEFMHRLRDERRFGGIDELVLQIKKDVEEVKNFLSNTN